MPHNGNYTRMDSKRRQEPQGRIKRQRESISEETGYELKTAATGRRLSEEVFLCPNERNEKEANQRKNSQRS
jgi:hypothetical protein